MSKFITDGTQFFKVFDKQPEGYAGQIWFVTDEQDEEVGLTNIQYNGMSPVDQEDIPFDVQEKFGLTDQQSESPKPEQVVEREPDLLVYTASGIDPVTAALILADEGVPCEEPDSVPDGNSLSSQVGRGAAQFLTVACTSVGFAIIARFFYFFYLR